MKKIVLKVQKRKLNEFLLVLHSETIVEMWMRLCDYHKRDYQPFNWSELVRMIFVNPHLVGIDLVDYEPDQNPMIEVISERIESCYNYNKTKDFDSSNNSQTNDEDFDGVDLDMLFFEQTR